MTKPAIRLSLLLTLFSFSYGVHAAQTCEASYPETTPTSRFIVHDDGTVTDKQTGLMWRQCELGTSGSNCSVGRVESFTWEEALQQVGTDFAGYSDWRLPNVKELQSIVEYQCADPAINENVFSSLSNSTVWTSSPFSHTPSTSWIVGFTRGIPGYTDRIISRSLIRLVR